MNTELKNIAAFCKDIGVNIASSQLKLQTEYVTTAFCLILRVIWSERKMRLHSEKRLIGIIS